MHIVLVVAGGVGNVEGVAFAGVPLGVDAVECQRDLAVDVGSQGLLRPGRVDFAGCNIGDIVPEGDSHIAGGCRRPAQMHRDVFGNDDSVQHPGHAVLHRLRAAAAVSGEKRMLRDDHRHIRDIAAFLGIGDHLRLGKGDLPGKDLHALNAHGAVACFDSSQIHNGVRPHRVIFLQRQGAGGRFNGKISGIALCVGDALDGKAVAGHGDENTLDGRGLTGTESLNA